MSIPQISDRLLHSHRRATAIRSLASGIAPGRVLFVCHGNICRSPFAEAVFGSVLTVTLASRYSTQSAGFIGPNRGSPPQAIAAAQRVGVDLSAHRSRLITGDMIRASSLVAVMSWDQAKGINTRFAETAPPLLVLGDLDPLPIDTRTIRDPWNCDDSVYDASYARIGRCVRELVRLITAASPVAETIRQT